MQKKEEMEPPPPPAVYWIETSDSLSRHYQFQPDGQLSVSIFIYLFIIIIPTLFSSSTSIFVIGFHLSVLLHY